MLSTTIIHDILQSALIYDKNCQITNKYVTNLPNMIWKINKGIELITWSIDQVWVNKWAR